MSKSIMNYDRKNDILYIVISAGEEHHFDEVADGIVVEYDKHGEPIGIEIFNASKALVKAIGRKRLRLTTA